MDFSYGHAWSADHNPNELVPGAGTSSPPPCVSHRFDEWSVVHAILLNCQLVEFPALHRISSPAQLTGFLIPFPAICHGNSGISTAHSVGHIFFPVSKSFPSSMLASFPRVLLRVRNPVIKGEASTLINSLIRLSITSAQFITLRVLCVHPGVLPVCMVGPTRPPVLTSFPPLAGRPSSASLCSDLLVGSVENVPEENGGGS